MKNGGLILWNAILICDMSKTSWRMEKIFTKGVSEKHLNAWSFRLVQVQLYAAKEETFQIQLKYIDVSRIDDSWYVDEVHIIE